MYIVHTPEQQGAAAGHTGIRSICTVSAKACDFVCFFAFLWTLTVCLTFFILSRRNMGFCFFQFSFLYPNRAVNAGKHYLQLVSRCVCGSPTAAFSTASLLVVRRLQLCSQMVKMLTVRFSFLNKITNTKRPRKKKQNVYKKGWGGDNKDVIMVF